MKGLHGGGKDIAVGIFQHELKDAGMQYDTPRGKGSFVLQRLTYMTKDTWLTETHRMRGVCVCTALNEHKENKNSISNSRLLLMCTVNVKCALLVSIEDLNTEAVK